MVGICPGSYFVTPILEEVDDGVTSTKLSFFTYV